MIAIRPLAVNTFPVSEILRIISTTKKYGGDLFEDEMQAAFEWAGHSVRCINPIPTGTGRAGKVPGYINNLLHIDEQAKNVDYVIRAMNHVFFMKSRPKQIVVAYHYDTAFSHPLVKAHHFLTLKSLVRNRNKINKLVVISKYWRDFFYDLGFKNIETIYCGFNESDFSLSDQDVQAFKKNHHLENKKIVYIGNPQRKKGADKVYAALKDRSDIVLVTSGNKDVELPCLNLNLPYKEYLHLLKASAAVITFSQFKEGWNRVAHEAMMLGVPVIGSGLGGMGELLDGGGQIIVTDPDDLNSALNKVLENSELGVRGREFAQTFTQERFRKACVEIVKG